MYPPNNVYKNIARTPLALSFLIIYDLLTRVNTSYLRNGYEDDRDHSSTK